MSVKKGHDTEIVRLDEGEEEESEMMHEAQVGVERGGRNRKRCENRRLMRRRWRKLGRGEGRKGTQGSSVTSEKLM